MPREDACDITPLLFGKYVGLTPLQLAEKDPGYVVWLKENVHGRGKLVSRSLYEECKEEVAERYEEDRGDWGDYET